MSVEGLLAACGTGGIVLLVVFCMRRERAPTPARRLAAATGAWISLIGSLALLQLSVPVLVDSYTWQILIKVGIYITLAVSLNIINGIAGQFSMGHAGFMAVGAYTAAYLTMLLGSATAGWARWLPWNAPWAAFAGSSAIAGIPGGLGGHVLFLISLVAGGLMAALAGYLVGIPSLRLKGDYLAIVTLGFGEIIRNLIANVDVIGASRGLPGVPHYSTLFWVYLFAALSVFVSYRLLATAPGRAMLAVREDEIAAAAMGIDTTRTKILAFIIGTFFAGVAGGLLAHHQEYLHPDYFKFDKSFEVIIMVVLGGMGSVSGAVVSAIILAIAPEALRYAKDLLGNLTEPSVLYAAAPVILFSALFTALGIVEIVRLLGRGAGGMLAAMRVRARGAYDASDLERMRKARRPSATSLLTALVSSRPVRDAGLGALAGLILGVLHRGFARTALDPRVEYAAVVIVGLTAGFIAGRRAKAAWKEGGTDRLDRDGSPDGSRAASEARGSTTATEAPTTVPSAVPPALGYRRFAAVGLLALPGFAIALILERSAPGLLNRVSVYFHDFPDPRMVLYSLMLIVLMLTRPTGLFGSSEIRTWWRARRGARGART